MPEQKNAAERAVEYFMQGYNCGQAVAAAFAERTGIREEQALMMASALGGGMCRMRETCGAVSGAMLILGMTKGYSDAADDTAKKLLYAAGQRMMLDFKEKFGTFQCGELLRLPKDNAPCPIPTPRTAEFYQSRPCARYVYEMARLLEEELNRD